MPWMMFLSALLAPERSQAFDLPAALEKSIRGEAGQRKPIGDISSEAPDNSMDPDLYRIGGGDGFQISIKDLPSNEYFPVVNPDGSLYLGDFGEIELGKSTLNEAKNLIRDNMRKALKKNYQVYITLKQVKRVTVTVGGSLPIPGTFQVAGTWRLLDVLKLANHNLPPAMDKFNLRQVTVTNRDSTKAYDLLRFLGGGESAQNPYVYPGDYIDLAPLDRSLTLTGQILGPVKGRIPLVPGEHLSDILPMIDPRASADSTYFLVRKSDGETVKLSRADAGTMLLEDNCVVIIPTSQNYGRQDTVIVTGQMARPGTYPIAWGRTRVSEIMDLAGGPTPAANPKRAFLVRRNKMFGQPSMDGESPGLSRLRQGNPASQVVRPEISASISDLAASGDYAIIDLSKDASSVILEGGDEIHVPRTEHYVYVSGHVRRPGAYPYSGGRSVDGYISLAGGYSPKSDPNNRFVMFHYQGINLIREDSQVREGDIIVVPASVEFKKLTSVYLPLFQALATVMSLALTIFVVSK